MPKHNTKRSKSYHKLKEAGFKSTEANKYKDLSDSKIDSLIELKIEHVKQDFFTTSILNRKIRKVLNND